MTTQRKILRLRNGGRLTYDPPMPITIHSSRTRDQEKPNEEVVEIHNYLPGGEEHMVTGQNIAAYPKDTESPEEEESDVVARYPAGYHAQTEGDEIVVYSRAPRHKTDLYDFKDTTRDSRPPRTLAELNRFFGRYYPRRKATAAR